VKPGLVQRAAHWPWSSFHRDVQEPRVSNAIQVTDRKEYAAMSLEPLKDEGQVLSPMAGMVIGVLDTRQDVDAAVSAINVAGIPDSEMLLLHGEDGINLIERFQNGTFYFADGPEVLFRRDKSVLNEGKYVLGVKVRGGEQAREVAALAKQQGGYGFVHFGMFVDTQIN